MSDGIGLTVTDTRGEADAVAAGDAMGVPVVDIIPVRVGAGECDVDGDPDGDFVAAGDGDGVSEDTISVRVAFRECEATGDADGKADTSGERDAEGEGERDAVTAGEGEAVCERNMLAEARGELLSDAAAVLLLLPAGAAVGAEVCDGVALALAVADEARDAVAQPLGGAEGVPRDSVAAGEDDGDAAMV